MEIYDWLCLIHLSYVYGLGQVIRSFCICFLIYKMGILVEPT